MFYGSPAIDRAIELPTSQSDYPRLDRRYTQNACSIGYSGHSVSVRGNYYDARRKAPHGHGISTAAIEQAIWERLSKETDPRTSEEFDHLFGRSPYTQTTSTGLRVPKGRKPGDYETGPDGRKYWIRTVLVDDKEVGEILVPEDGIVEEMDPVFGVPTKTSEKPTGSTVDIDRPYFWFNYDPTEDIRTGSYDIGIMIYRFQLQDDYGHRLLIRADAERFFHEDSRAFRLIRGEPPEIVSEKMSSL